MATRLYSAYNGPMVTTSPPAKVTTSTTTKTMMQLLLPATLGLEIVEWGISFDGASAATPGQCELIDTVAVGSTITTAYLQADITKLSQAALALGSNITLGSNATATSGFTATAEGTIVATRQLDSQLLPPTAPYIKQFPLERGPEVVASEFVRIRVTFAAAIGSLCYLVWAE